MQVRTTILPLVGLFLLSPAMAERKPMAITITAGRIAEPQDNNHLPVNVTTVTSREITNSGAQNLTQALQNLTSVYIKNTYGVSGSKTAVDLGGFGPNANQNTLVLINGRRVNDADLSGANLAAIPLEQIERIEVIHGSSTVLYGDNAAGGVINIITKRPGEGKKAGMKATAGSFSTQRASGFAQTTMGNADIAIRADTGHSDGYRDYNTLNDAHVQTELNWRQGGNIWGGRILASKEDLELPGSLKEAVYISSPRSQGTFLSKSRESRVAAEGFFESDGLAGELSFRRKLQKTLSNGFNSAMDVKTFSLTPRVRREIAAHTLTSGVDWYRSDLTQDSEFNANAMVRNSYAFYASDDIRVAEHTYLNVGARHQGVKVNPKVATKSPVSEAQVHQKDSLNAWDLGLRQRLGNGARAYARLAQSFRFATVDEMAVTYPTANITLLAPQKGRHAEIGAQLPLPNDARLDINLFTASLRHEIGYDNSVFANINFEPTRHNGLDLIFTQPLLPNWTIKANYTYRDAYFRAGAHQGKRIPEVPKQRLVLANQFKIDARQGIDLTARYLGRRYFGDDFDNVAKRMPSYVWVDLGYHFTGAGWQARVGVRNLTNKKTAEYGIYRTSGLNYYPLPERSYSLSVEKTF